MGRAVFAVDDFTSCTDVIEHEHPFYKDVRIAILVNGRESANFSEGPATY